MKTRTPIIDRAVSAAAVKELLRDVGYVLWLSRKLAQEMQAEKCEPVRPEMSEFCAVEIASCAA